MVRSTATIMVITPTVPLNRANARHAADAGSDDASRAGSGSSGMTTRLEIYEQRRAIGAIARILEREHLRMRLAGSRMASLPHHDAVGHDNGADERVWRGHAFSAARMK